MNWDGNNTSYMPLPLGRQQIVLEQFSINNTTDIRLCYRCGEEGHIRKYCNTNVHCEFCKSYTHCKVIRVDTRTTNYKQSPTTVNIDRPAHIKTDKQCRTHTTSTAWLPDG